MRLRVARSWIVSVRLDSFGSARAHKLVERDVLKNGLDMVYRYHFDMTRTRMNGRALHLVRRLCFALSYYP